MGASSKSGAPIASPRTPSVLVVLSLEAAPTVVIDALDEREAQRLGDWLCSHDDYLELVDRAQEIAERDRAA
jgi:hypothetical protein